MPTGSPGDGITPALLSREPLATEGEATPGPDDVNPLRQLEMRREAEVEARRMAEEEARAERQRTMNPVLSGGVFELGGMPMLPDADRENVERDGMSFGAMPMLPESDQISVPGFGGGDR